MILDQPRNDPEMLLMLLRKMPRARGGIGVVAAAQRRALSSPSFNPKGPSSAPSPTCTAKRNRRSANAMPYAASMACALSIVRAEPWKLNNPLGAKRSRSLSASPEGLVLPWGVRSNKLHLKVCPSSRLTDMRTWINKLSPICGVMPSKIRT